MTPHEQTWTLARFRAAQEADDNLWWRIGCGHHQNLLEEALDQLDAFELVRVQMVEALVEIRRRNLTGHAVNMLALILDEMNAALGKIGATPEREGQ